MLIHRGHDRPAVSATRAQSFCHRLSGGRSVVPASRSRKKARATALRANLLIAGIVLFCFVVLVGLMIFLAQVFGK